MHRWDFSAERAAAIAERDGARGPERTAPGPEAAAERGTSAVAGARAAARGGEPITATDVLILMAGLCLAVCVLAFLVVVVAGLPRDLLASPVLVGVASFVTLEVASRRAGNIGPGTSHTEGGPADD